MNSLDNMSPEEILKHLTPEQRLEFEEMLADPAKAAGLLDLENMNRSCWWLSESKTVDEESVTTSRFPTSLQRTRLLKSTASAVTLQYNLLAIL